MVEDKRTASLPCLQERLQEFYDEASVRGVASFDVFDTAIWRRVAQPTHIFPVVEGDIRTRRGADAASGFAQARVEAEQIARQTVQRAHGGVEVTLDEIYRALPRIWDRPPDLLAFARRAELQAERDHVEVEPAIHAVYRRLKAEGIATIFVSDVYLGEEDVRALLVKCGYDGRDPLFVSSALERAKWDGSMWDLVTRDLGITTRAIAHIGDNRAADVDAAREAGLAAFHWPGRSRHNKYESPVGPATLPLSRLKSREQSPSLQEGDAAAFWPRLGRTHGTLIFGAFLRWIAERTTGADHVYFCARDGQPLFALWQELVAPNRLAPTASYLHVSRRSLIVPRLHHLSEAALDFLVSGVERRSIRAYLDRAGLIESVEVVARAERLFGSLEASVETPADLARLRDFFRSCEPELTAVARTRRGLIDAYLEQEGVFSGGRRVIVDLGWRGNLQRALAASIRERGATTTLSGLYFGLTRDAGINRGISGWMEGMVSSDFTDETRDRQLRQMVTILEQLHAADHGSVEGYERGDSGVTPILRDNAMERHQHAQAIVPFQQAATDQLRQVFAGTHMLQTDELTPASAWAALVDLCLYPSGEEARMLGDLRYLDGFEHAGDGLPIAALLEDRSREGMEAVMLGHTWKAGALKNWLGLRPDLGDTIRDVARDQHLGTRWAGQFR